MQSTQNNKTTDKVSLWHIFFDMFEKAGFLFLFFFLVYIAVYMAHTQGMYSADGTAYLPAGGSSVFDVYIPAVSQTGTNAANGNVQDMPQSVDFSKAPQSREEIAAYYAAVLNRAKTDAASVTLVHKTGSNYNGVVEAGGNAFLSSVAKSLMRSFLKEENPNTVFTARSEIQENFIPRGTTSHLTADDIADAVCKEDGAYYMISVRLQPDQNPKAGYGSGAVGSIITKEEIESAVNGKIKMENLVCAYDGAVSEIKVEKASGKLVEIRTSLPMYLQLSSLGLDCRIGLQFDEFWTVQW